MALPTTFEPGENLDTLGIEMSASLLRKNLVVGFPSRIHVTPVDCNRFAFSKPGGGGIGFAIDLPNKLKIAPAASVGIRSSIQHYDHIVNHYIKLMEKVLHVELRIELSLSLSELMSKHFGLGSSVCVACAVMWSINRLCGNPLTLEQLRLLIAHNFVEECQGRLSRGLETGVGTSVIFRGGISVIADQIIEVFHRPFPEGYSVLIVDPVTSRPEMDKPESEDMLERTFFLDSSYRYTKAYNILMDVIPALNSGDLRVFGEYVWDIQFSGTHLSMIQSYEAFGRKIYDVLSTLRASGAMICGISSVGPAIYCVCESKNLANIEADLNRRYGGEISKHLVAVNNTGIQEID